MSHEIILQYTWTTDRMWRKNRKRVLEDTSDNCVGVDINRNFPTGFRLVRLLCMQFTVRQGSWHSKLVSGGLNWHPEG